MSGAGALGAYQAAVYVGLVNNLPAEEVTYDVITGVSAGSLNSLGLSMFEASDVEDASLFIYGLWNSIPQYKAFSTWKGGILVGFFKKGLFDLAPGREWITDQIGNLTLKRKVTFSAINANTGQYMNYDYNATYDIPDTLIDSAFASSSIPGIFPHITRGDVELIDGGTVWNIDIDSPIRRCREVTEKDEDITVDTIIVSAAKIDEQTDFSGYSALDHYYRGQEIFSYYNGMNDYNSSMNNYPKVNFRYLIAPTKKLSKSPLDVISFNQKIVDRCFEAGQRDASLAVNLGPGGMRDAHLEFAERHQKGEDIDINDIYDRKLNEIRQNS